jgi:hypothetical protein
MFFKQRLPAIPASGKFSAQASYKQIHYLLFLARKRGHDVGSLNRYLQKHLGKKSVLALDVSEVNSLIRKFKS